MIDAWLMPCDTKCSFQLQVPSVPPLRYPQERCTVNDGIVQGVMSFQALVGPENIFDGSFEALRLDRAWKRQIDRPLDQIRWPAVRVEQAFDVHPVPVWRVCPDFDLAFEFLDPGLQ